MLPKAMQTIVWIKIQSMSVETAKTSFAYFALFCKNNSHKTISKNFRKHVEQAKIQKIMAENNITFLETESDLENSYTNVLLTHSFKAFDLDNTVNFPVPHSKYPKQNHNIQSQRFMRRPIPSPAHDSGGKTETG